MHLCLLSIPYTCLYHYPSTAMGHEIPNADITKLFTQTMPHMLSASSLSGENREPSLNRTAVHKVLQGQACRWASLRRLLVVCAEILWLHKPTAAAAARAAGLRPSWRLRSWMWRSWLVRLHMVCGHQSSWMYCPILWYAFGDGSWWKNKHSRGRGLGLEDMPAVNMPTACSTKTCDIVLGDKTFSRGLLLWGSPVQ